MNKKLNIGLLIDDLNNHFTNQACKGAEIAAKAIGANLFIIPGHYIGMTDSRYGFDEYEYQYNTMFNLPNEEMIDVLYILMGTIGSRASLDLQMEFLEKYSNIPIVILFAKVDGFHSVTFDNISGMTSLMEHFNSHNYKKYGYVSGPLTNRDACERLEVFKSMMEKYGNELKPSQIVEGDFTDVSEAAVNELLDKNPDLEVILFGNDRMALGGYKALRDRGLEPGKDIFIAGFDDDANSSTSEPPLTTIEANSADLAYKAILHAEEFIEKKTAVNLSVETFLVQRSSCGCNGLDVDGFKKRLYIDQIMDGSRKCITSCEKYLFGVFQDQGDVVNVKNATKGFLESYFDFVVGGMNDDGKVGVVAAYDELIKTNVIEYLSSERFINVLTALHDEGLNDTDNPDKKAMLNQLFSDFYRKLSVEVFAAKENYESRRDGITRLVNIQTGELFIKSDDEEIPYEHLVDRFNEFGFNGAYIYFFQGNTVNKSDNVWKAPNTCLLKAYIGSKGDAIALSEEQQLMRTERIFNNEYTEECDSRTMTVFPLFVGEDLFGLFVVDLDTKNLVNVSPMAYQLSVTIKSLLTIEAQYKTKKELQNSLEQFMRDNNLLSKAARTDELTGLFNRRGFLEYTQKQITDPMNIDRNAIICYADMDNLKMVNDVYGHDEGDFSLKTIAQSLTDAFRNTDIIGRLGGDEFVAFAIVDEAHYGESIKKRIQEILKKSSDSSGKPYPIEMSIGYAEFKCAHDKDIYELLDIADNALYNEKRERKAKNGTYR